MTVLVDADAFIAIMNKDDALHQRAIELVRELHTKNAELYTSWDVVDETATKLSYSLSKKRSLVFLKYLEQYDVKILFPSFKRARQAQLLFVQTASKRISMTDCMNMTLVREMKIDSIFSFDQGYRKCGFKLFSDQA